MKEYTAAKLYATIRKSATAAAAAAAEHEWEQNGAIKW